MSTATQPWDVPYARPADGERHPTAPIAPLEPGGEVTTGETWTPGTHLGLTPSQTVGPYLAIGLTWEDGPYAVAEGTPGAVRIEGVLYDGNGDPIPDGMVETWQADPAVGPHFRGLGRAKTDPQGRFWVLTVKPAPVPGPDGTTQAPHLVVSVFARGMLDRTVTRMYFPEDAALEGPGGHAADPVLALVPAARRSTLVAVPSAGGYTFDIRVQGDGETVFFDV